MVLSKKPTDFNIQNTWTKSHEEVKKSLDVLDKVLSEFDDIEGLSDSEETQTNEEVDGHVEESSPPPVNRSLKPKDRPPELPKKQKQVIAEPLHNTSTKSSISEASSHEYQEINSILRESSRKAAKAQPFENNNKQGVRKRPVSVSQEPKFTNNKTNLRKCRSGDIVPENPSRSRKFERRQPPIRSKSSDRLLEDRSSFHSMPHSRNEHKMSPRISHTLPMDERFMDIPEPMMGFPGDPHPMMAPPDYFRDPRMALLDHRYPFPDIPHYHQMLHEGPAHSLPVRGVDMIPHPMDYPAPFNPSMMGPAFLPPEYIDGRFPAGYPGPMDYLDPRMYPMDIPPPFDYPTPIGYPGPQDMFIHDRRDFDPPWNSYLPYHDRGAQWGPAEQERLRNLQQKQAMERRLEDQMHMSGMQHKQGRRHTGPPDLGASPHVPSRSYSFGTDPNDVDIRVNGDMREHLDNKENTPTDNTSLPQFTSCGKDSGFYEGITVDDNSPPNGQKQNGSAGNFIVSGVFNDSSKMYIPAPPSPTPDYDEEILESEVEESSELLQSTLYDVPGNSSMTQKQIIRTSSTGSSVSQDSLQEPSARKGTQTLQAMINEFHRGLPLPKEEVCYSDDSLEESSVAHSRPSTLGPSKNMSLESLTSMDGSTTSFDYLSGGNNRSPKKSRSSSSNFINSKNKKNSKRSDTSDSEGKFDTIRHMIKKGLIEGLDEKPPNFKPPPLTKNNVSMLGSPEKPDSGINSGASTSRTNESGNSDNVSDKYNSKALVKSSSLSYSNPPLVTKKAQRPQSMFSLNDLAPEVLSPSTHYGTQTTSQPTTNVPRNNSWLHKKKRLAPQPNSKVEGKLSSKDKITHVDHIQSKSSLSSSSRSPTPNGDSLSFGTIEKHKWSSSEPQTQPSVINESPRFGEQPRGKPPKGVDKSQKRPTKESISSPSEFRRLEPSFGDRTRPRISSTRIAPSPPALRTPNDRKFESSENLATITRDRSYTNPQDNFTTLPQPLTSAEDEVKEFRKTASLIVGKKKKDDESKFKFKLFGGFWKKNKYSFDKA